MEKINKWKEESYHFTRLITPLKFKVDEITYIHNIIISQITIKINK